MSVNVFADGYIDVSTNEVKLTQPLEITGTVNFPIVTQLADKGILQNILVSKLPLINPTIVSMVEFENLNVDNIPIQSILENYTISNGNNPSVSFGTAVLVSGQLYIIRIPFNSSIELPYLANIVINEIDGVTATAVIVTYNTDYLQFRILKQHLNNIIIHTYKSVLNINCAIIKDSNIIACENINVTIIGVLDN